MTTFKTPHSTDEFRELAARSTILRTQVGSGVYGTAVDDQDDRDELGVCVESPDYVIGLRRFEQYEYRTQPVGVRSGPGDLDLTIYSLRKWTRLALAGNPSILVPLFVPYADVVRATQLGVELRVRPELVLSRRAGARYLGYLNSQRSRLEADPARPGRGDRGHTNRPELIERYGFDTKYAYHMIRLGMQGVELVTTGRITLPIPEPHRTWLVELRRGEHSLRAALALCGRYERQLVELLDDDQPGPTRRSPLPLLPDYDRANAFLTRAYRDTWSGIPTRGAWYVVD
jgi:uncharacterized protein